VFGSLGFTEIAVILVLALLLFGPKRLPEIGRTLGKGLAEFRRATNDLKRTFESEMELDQTPARRPPPATPMQALPAPVVAQMNAVPVAAAASDVTPVAPAAGEAAPSAAPAGAQPPVDPSSSA
jgi:TatA/E family protein of Tat protein translocase